MRLALDAIAEYIHSSTVVCNHLLPNQFLIAIVRLGCAKVMMDFLAEWQEKLHVKITCSQVRLTSPHLIAVARPASCEAYHSRYFGQRLFSR